MTNVLANTVLRLALTSGRDYDNPLWDAEVRVELTAPSGKVREIEGYWDGGRAWRVAVSPDEPGAWRWHSLCSDTANAGLHGVRGSFECVPYSGDNALFARGPLRVSADGSHLEHADGTPFFWLADTAWNGVIRGDDANWARYLDTRAAQGFTAVQFVVPHWRGDARDEAGEAACTETHPIRINPAYFQRKDRRIAMVNERGLVAAPVALWTLLESDLGWKLPEADAERLARYIVARYDAHQVVWLLGGDGNYQKMGVERWRRLGRAVFARGHDRPATLHPCGQNWVGEEFRSEPWFDLIGYQSGHGDGEAHVRWLALGPPAREWDRQPPRPVINLEPNYETAHGYQHGTEFTAFHVRRAAYWSLLVSPTAGVTYGHDAIWNWNFETGPSEGHGNWHAGGVPPWHTGLQTEGLRGMTILQAFFASLPWHRLRPAQGLLAEQPGERDIAAFVAAARTPDGAVAVVYTPQGGTLRLAEPFSGEAQWFDPRQGTRRPAGPGPREFTAPDGNDWVLLLRR